MEESKTITLFLLLMSAPGYFNVNPLKEGVGRLDL